MTGALLRHYVVGYIQEIPMDNHELQTLLTTENDRVEWKKSINEAAIESACALANDLSDSRTPGHLVIGVDKKGNPVGVKGSIDDAQRLITDKLRSTKVLPTPSFDVVTATIGGARLLVVSVQPYPVPPIVTVNGTAWVRSGSETVRAREADLQRLRERRPENTQPFDTRPLAHASIDDLGPYLRELYEVTRNDDDKAEGAFPDFTHWLEQQQLGRIGAGVFRPNPAAMLVFGSSPQSYFPGALVEFVRYSGMDIDSPIQDRKTASGTIPDQLQVLWAQIQAHVSEILVGGPGGIKSELRPEYPIEGLRELARNLVQHRAYEGTNAPGRIEWFPDRIEFSNPGGPFGRASEGGFGDHADYRNPMITTALAGLGYVERLGRGIRLLKIQLEKNGNPPLIMQTDGFTRVVVRK